MTDLEHAFLGVAFPVQARSCDDSVSVSFSPAGLFLLPRPCFNWGGNIAYFRETAKILCGQLNARRTACRRFDWML